jgi:hypothetical protein
MNKYNEEQMEAVYEDYKKMSMEKRAKLPLKVQEIFNEIDSLKERMEKEGIPLIFLVKSPTRKNAKFSVYSWSSFLKDQKTKVNFNLDNILSNYKKTFPIIVDMCCCMADLIAMYLNVRVYLTEPKSGAIVYDTGGSNDEEGSGEPNKQ